MVNANPFGKLQKMWAMTSGDAIFLLFLVCSVDLDIPCRRLSSSTTTKFMVLCFFMHKISIQVVCVNEQEACPQQPQHTQVYGKRSICLAHKNDIFLFTKLFKLVASSFYKKLADLYEQSS